MLVLHLHPFASCCQNALIALYGPDVDEARPYRELFPLPWPTDMDALDPV
jgi:hypothetical protein